MNRSKNLQTILVIGFIILIIVLVNNAFAVQTDYQGCSARDIYNGTGMDCGTNLDTRNDLLRMNITSQSVDGDRERFFNETFDTNTTITGTNFSNVGPWFSTSAWLSAACVGNRGSTTISGAVFRLNTSSTAVNTTGYRAIDFEYDYVAPAALDAGEFIRIFAYSATNTRTQLLVVDGGDALGCEPIRNSSMDFNDTRTFNWTFYADTGTMAGEFLQIDELNLTGLPIMNTIAVNLTSKPIAEDPGLITALTLVFNFSFNASLPGDWYIDVFDNNAVQWVNKMSGLINTTWIQPNITLDVSPSDFVNSSGHVMTRIRTDMIRKYYNATNAFNLSVDWFNTSVTFISNRPPRFKDNTTNFGLSTPYSPGKNLGFQANWSDPDAGGNAAVSKAIFEINLSGTITNYTRFTTPAINNGTDGVYTINFTMPQTRGAGQYQYRWFANDTSNSFNQTTIVIFEITQNDTKNMIMNLTLNGTEADLSRTYRFVHNATANSSAVVDAVLAFNFTRNTTHLASNLVDGNTASEQLDRAVGQYNFTYNTSGNANYSSATKSLLLTVFNSSQSAELKVVPYPNTYGNPTTATCIGNGTDFVGGIVSPPAYGLFRNASDVTATENNTALVLPTLQWAYVCNVTNTQNYTFSTNYSLYNISKADLNVTLQLNGTQGNRNYTERQVANFTAYTNFSLVENTQKLILTSNYTGWIDLTSNQYIFNTTNLTTVGQNWNISGYFVGNGNISYRQQFYLFNVTAVPPNQVPQYKDNTTNFGLSTPYSPGKNYGFQINWTDLKAEMLQ